MYYKPDMLTVSFCLQPKIVVSLLIRPFLNLWQIAWSFFTYVARGGMCGDGLTIGALGLNMAVALPTQFTWYHQFRLCAPNQRIIRR